MAGKAVAGQDALMPLYRGFRLISPDDMRGVTVAGRRVSGKEARQGKYARRAELGEWKGK